MNNSIKKLSKSYPKAQKNFDSIAKIHESIDSLEIKPFFEPLEWYDMGNNPQPLFLTPDLLAAWLQHISYGAIVRLRSLEAGFLSELAAGRFITAMVLARSHMENAGLAAFAEQELLKAMDLGRWDDLKPIISKMFFGTSFRFEKQLLELQEKLSLEATLPVKPKDLIRAMEEFLKSIGNQNSQLRGVYALLCEYAHPNIGGSKAFQKNVMHEDSSGWTNYYNLREKIRNSDVVAATNILLTNMKIGYANALLLITGEIEELPEGVRYHKTPDSAGKIIWDAIIQA